MDARSTDSRNGRVWLALGAALLAAAGFFFLYGTETGEAARQAVDDTADAVTGNQAVREGRELERQLRQVIEERPEASR